MDRLTTTRTLYFDHHFNGTVVLFLFVRFLVCEDGLYDDGYGGDCRECEVGTYKPHPGNETCPHCPSNMNTTSTGQTECGEIFISLIITSPG